LPPFSIRSMSSLLGVPAPRATKPSLPTEATAPVPPVPLPVLPVAALAPHRGLHPPRVGAVSYASVKTRCGNSAIHCPGHPGKAPGLRFASVPAARTRPHPHHKVALVTKLPGHRTGPVIPAPPAFRMQGRGRFPGAPQARPVDAGSERPVWEWHP